MRFLLGGQMSLDVRGHRERIRTRFLRGEESLQDYEILELLLTYARPRVDTKSLAKHLLRRFGSLGGVLGASAVDLRKLKGMGEVTSTLLGCVHACLRRVRWNAIAHRSVFNSWASVLDYCHASMGAKEIEYVRLLLLGEKLELLEDVELQRGTINASALYPREVIRRVLDRHATGFILVHNHPGDDADPSREDIVLTRRLYRVSKELDIVMHDHLIIARSGCTSFKTRGLLD